jgi:hypothetical protein
VAEVLASAGEPVRRLASSAAVDRLMALTAGDPLLLALRVADLEQLPDDRLDAEPKASNPPSGLEPPSVARSRDRPYPRSVDPSPLFVRGASSVSSATTSRGKSSRNRRPAEN